MKKSPIVTTDNKNDKKGYNEHNPGQPQGAFPPASAKQQPSNDKIKSNTADKKAKEDSAN